MLDCFVYHARKPGPTSVGLDGGECGGDYFFVGAVDVDELASELAALVAGVLHQRSTQS